MVYHLLETFPNDGHSRIMSMQGNIQKFKELTGFWPSDENRQLGSVNKRNFLHQRSSLRSTLMTKILGMHMDYHGTC